MKTEYDVVVLWGWVWLIYKRKKRIEEINYIINLYVKTSLNFEDDFLIY